MSNCASCGSPTSPSTDGTEGSHCPACGKSQAAAIAPKASSLVQDYVSDLREILTRPAAFFRKMPVTGGYSGPLAFALVTHWVGTAIEYLWQMLFGGTTAHYIRQWILSSRNDSGRPWDALDIDSQGRSAEWLDLQERAMDWIWGAGSVIADPFLTLATIFFTSFLVYVGARILVTPGKNGAPREITFESALRIICFGMTPAILGVIPLAGPVIASLGTAIVTIIGAREVYRISTGRAILVGLFPKVLFLAIMGGGLLLMALLFFKMAVNFF